MNGETLFLKISSKINCFMFNLAECSVSFVSFSTGFTSSGSTNPFDSQVQDDFAAVFGGQQSTVDSSSAMGDILVPLSSTGGGPQAPVDSSLSMEQTGCLHSSLERVAKSLGEGT